jgi:DTW domain-containing protein YfiP
VDLKAARAPDTLLVIDGTWSQARKLIKLNPLLSALPRIGFVPSRPSQYRIRSEPAEHCVSTVEAVVEALSLLEEGGRARFEPMLEAFTWFVDHNLEQARLNHGPRRRRKKPGVKQDAALLAFARETRQRQVLVFAEANAQPKAPVRAHAPEVVHWVAVRVATGERFEAFVRPRTPLHPCIPGYLEVSAEQLLSGASVEAALSQWRAFAREDDVYAGWGQFSRRLLFQEGAQLESWVDYRVVLSKLKAGIRTLDVEQAAQLLAPGPLRQAGGRAQRRLSALERLREAL